MEEDVRWRVLHGGGRPQALGRGHRDPGHCWHPQHAHSARVRTLRTILAAACGDKRQPALLTLPFKLVEFFEEFQVYREVALTLLKVHGGIKCIVCQALGRPRMQPCWLRWGERPGLGKWIREGCQLWVLVSQVTGVTLMFSSSWRHGYHSPVGRR